MLQINIFIKENIFMKTKISILDNIKEWLNLGFSVHFTGYLKKEKKEKEKKGGRISHLLWTLILVLVKREIIFSEC